MTARVAAKAATALLAILLALVSAAGQAGNELKFEIAVLPGFQRHVPLLEYPGYIGILLENNDLPPTLSSRMVIRQRGREVAAKNVVIRYKSKQGNSYAYDADVSLGLGKASIGLPVTVDVSALSAGKVVVAADLPLAVLISNEKRHRMQAKVAKLANAAAQRRILGYLDQRWERSAKDPTPLLEAILVDAYNRSGGAGIARQDFGDAVPLSEQWMLLITIAVWFVLLPIALLVRRLRRHRAKPAVS